jgi:membrane protease YdiL (CAAX protease family)
MECGEGVPAQQRKSPFVRKVAEMRTSTLGLVWSGYLVIAILLLAVTPALVYPVVVIGAGLALALAVPRTRALSWRPVGHDLGRLLGLYLACVGLFYVAFQVFTVDNVPGLFISFGAGLVLGVAGPAVHVVVGRGRSLADLGLTRDRLPETLTLAVLLAAVQAAITLPTVSFGAPSEWLPLLVMALVVGLFEAVFFRAYVIAIVEPMAGIIPAVAVSAALYALYHVGYGMTGGEMVFLFGLGIVYAVAYAVARNILVLWPLLTPVGGFFATAKAGDITLPLVAILGFADVFGLMLLSVFLVTRWQRRHPRTQLATGTS